MSHFVRKQDKSSGWALAKLTLTKTQFLFLDEFWILLVSDKNKNSCIKCEDFTKSRT